MSSKIRRGQKRISQLGLINLMHINLITQWVRRQGRGKTCDFPTERREVKGDPPDLSFFSLPSGQAAVSKVLRRVSSRR